MQHRIETTITTIGDMSKAFSEIRMRLGATQFERSVVRDTSITDHLVLIINGNGAILRDVCDMLDVNGYLD